MNNVISKHFYRIIFACLKIEKKITSKFFPSIATLKLIFMLITMECHGIDI